MDMFQPYWYRQVQKMEDVCRQEREACGSIAEGLPTIFFTIAPAEWKYVLHKTLFVDGSLSDQQDLLTLHLYHTLGTLLDMHLFKEGISLADVGIAKVRQWSLRYEFQARGTLHIHAVMWADLLPGWTSESVTGRTGSKTSKFVELLEKLFHSRADVQCGDGTQLLLRYVAGYVSKASDSLVFEPKQAHNQEKVTHWRQVYRLLCKRSPMAQEIVMEFAGLPMVKHSFTGVAMYPPIPGSSAKNSSRHQYEAYQYFLTQHTNVLGSAVDLCFMEWLRKFRVTSSPTAASPTVVLRNSAGPGSNKTCAVAMQFPFELLDIYIGAWAACFLKNMQESRLLPDTEHDRENYPMGHAAEQVRRGSFQAPEGCKHLKAVLCLDMFQTDNAPPNIFSPDAGKLLAAMQEELTLRAIGADREATFKARVHACTLLLLAIRDGREDAAMWSAKRVPNPPEHIWSPEQAEVLRLVKKGLSVEDAADRLSSYSASHRRSWHWEDRSDHCSCSRSLKQGCRVLIAGPIGLLMSMYKLRLPADENLVMETIHSSFRIVRDADAPYSPPGRLKTFDVIIFDEVSQIDATTWNYLKIALSELSSRPFIIFVGDFQQLQPIAGGPQLEADLEEQIQQGSVLAVELRQHQGARSVDPIMLDFLQHCRLQQPSRAEVQHFFHDRVWPADIQDAVAKAKHIEGETENFTFLTVTNRGAKTVNMACLARDYPAEALRLQQGAGIPADSDNIIVSPGMRLRLTHNVDKDRGFVNGASGKVQSVLRHDVFILKTSQNVPILVHPITLRGRKYLPVSYGWATTIRRAQGATLNKIALWFDRRVADKGYAYVGLSRARKATDVYLIGKIRRTDWRAVGTNNEQLQPSHLSDTTETGESRSADDFEETDEDFDDSTFDDSTNDFPATSDEPNTETSDSRSADDFDETDEEPSTSDFDRTDDEPSTAES